jgi:hypothetical protein
MSDVKDNVRKVGLLTDGSGDPSSMRVGFMIVVITACAVALGAVVGYILSIVWNRDLTILSGALGGLAGVIGSLLVPAFGGKAAQTFGEAQSPDQDTTNVG